MKLPIMEPSAIIIPFGKHKGATVAELLAKDPAYADWIMAQGWVAERFAELHAAILSRGAGTDDSPEHNVIQARFLDPVFRAAVLMAAFYDDVKAYQQRVVDKAWKECGENEEEYFKKYPRGAIISMPTTAKFEVRGIDVIIEPDFSHELRRYSRGRSDGGAYIEIKPTMGEDYPSVLRQARRLGAHILVVGEYIGQSVAEPLVREMFKSSGIVMVSVRDIEAEIPIAREFVKSE